MKTLADQVDLSDEVETITMTEFRKRPGDILTQASLGKTFIITRAGKVLACMAPPERVDMTHEVLPDGSCPTLGIEDCPKHVCDEPEAHGVGDRSKIEWTDATWNPIRGCSPVSEGCRHCYAVRMAVRHCGKGRPYEGLVKKRGGFVHFNGKVAFVESALDQPIHWKKPRRVFVNSMSDLFHDQVTGDIVARIWAVMAACPQHTFQVLTKRPKNAAYWTGKVVHLTNILPLPNVWIGTSVEDQKTAEQRIPEILAVEAAVHFVSLEPLLGPVHLLADWLRELDWVIIGGESGPGARPMHPDWVRSIVKQCTTAGVPVLFKQWGEWVEVGQLPPDVSLIDLPRRARQSIGGKGDEITVVRRLGKSLAGRYLDGKIWDQYPA